MQTAISFEPFIMGFLSQQGDTCCIAQVHPSSLGARKPDIRRHVISGVRYRAYFSQYLC